MRHAAVAWRPSKRNRQYLSSWAIPLTTPTEHTHGTRFHQHNGHSRRACWIRWQSCWGGSPHSCSNRRPSFSRVTHRDRTTLSWGPEITSLCQEPHSPASRLFSLPKSPRQPSPSDRPTCWYHQKYGAKARKRVPPCNYDQPSNEQASR